MSILYEPFKDEDAISAAIDRYWDEAYWDLFDEDGVEPTPKQIEARALELAEKSCD